MVIKSGGPGSESLRLAHQSEEAIRRAETAGDEGERQRLLAQAKITAGESELAAAYTYLQRAVALIAVLLPGTLIVGNELFGGTLRGSISSYYYTHMGNVFVGSLCALAVFFLSYNYRPLRSFERDALLAKFTAGFAVGVAVFPTSANAGAADGWETAVSALHFACACALFALLAVFARYRFTMTSGAVTPEKLKRNRLYRFCGNLMFGAMALAIVSKVVEPPRSWHALLWLETVCILAFGVSWLVKGGFGGILADKPPAPSPALHQPGG